MCTSVKEFGTTTCLDVSFHVKYSLENNCVNEVFLFFSCSCHVGRVDLLSLLWTQPKYKKNMYICIFRYRVLVIVLKRKMLLFMKKKRKNENKIKCTRVGGPMHVHIFYPVALQAALRCYPYSFQ